jgi:hypothetical protein
MDAKVVRSGMLAGMFGGAVMAMWSMLVLAATGDGFWQPLNLIAHTVWRGAPLDGGFSAGALVLGLAIHMMTSATLGVVIAVAAHRRRAAAVMVGMTVGLGVWLVNQYAVWPLLDSAAADRFTPWVFAVGHLMFGVAAALAVLRLHGPAPLAGRRTITGQGAVPSMR